jgi:O-antigen/teichoic acid export membrane protein
MWVPQLLVNALRVGLFALALSLISTERVTPWLVAWLYVGTAAVPACLLLTFFFARRQQTFGTIRPAVPKLLGLGLPLLAAGLVTGPVVNQCMPLLLAAERSSTEVGLFSAAWTFQSLMFLPVWVISLPGLALWSRMIGESDAHGQVVSFDFAGRWSLALTALASLLFIAMPALMLRTVFGEAFVSAGPALQVFGWGTIIASVAGPLGVVMMARGQAARIFAIAAVSATIALLTTLLLVKRMGAMGVAIGYSTMNSVSVGLSVLSADTSVRVTLFSTTYRSFVACVALAFAATLGCARLIVRADLWGAAMTVAVFLVGLILSLGVVRPFGPVDRALAHAILGAIRRRWPA